MQRTAIKDIVNKKGEEVILKGWVHRVRGMGKMMFLDLRDRSAICQVGIFDKELVEKAKDLGSEFVIEIKGKVNERPEKQVNKEMITGEVEIETLDLKIITKSETPPFEIEEKGDKQEASEELRLKYRYLDLRRERMQKNIKLRHDVVRFIREFLYKKDFWEIDTPLLGKSTPEGARDYLVPARRYPGKFYALPQSPQQYKQMLMVGGMEKYFQIAPCFRDEDARADRSPGEFYQLDMEMSFVEQGDVLRLTEEMFIELVKKVCPEKKITSTPFIRITWQEAMDKYGTDKPDLRKDKNDPNELAFAWVVDWPLFEPELEDGHYAPAHHMFTQPQDPENFDKDPGKAKSWQHDLVLNGVEVGGGSMRIHQPEVQEKVFELIGFNEDQKKEFSHMLEAFKYGVPPHGGIAPGIDRLLMILAGEKNIKEVIAFPKSDQAVEAMTNCPSKVSQEQLDELSINIKK